MLDIIQRSLKNFVAEFRVMAATSPGDVRGHFCQDPRQFGPHRVVAPWVLEEFPELATHKDDPFHLYLEGEESFERSRKERVLNYIGKYEAAVFVICLLLSIVAFALYKRPRVADETDIAVVCLLMYAVRFVLRGFVRWWAGDEFGAPRTKLPHAWLLWKMRAEETAMLPMTIREVALYRWGHLLGIWCGGNFLPLSILTILVAIPCAMVDGLGPVLEGSPSKMCALLALPLIFFACQCELKGAAWIRFGASRSGPGGLSEALTRILILFAGSLRTIGWYLLALGVVGIVSSITKLEVRWIPAIAAILLLVGTPPGVRGWSHRAARYYAARSMEDYIANQLAAVADADTSRGEKVVRDAPQLGF